VRLRVQTSDQPGVNQQWRRLPSYGAGALYGWQTFCRVITTAVNSA
jgi:hypothetical protein